MTTSRPRTRVILHGGKSAGERLRPEVERLRAAGVELDVVPTWAPGDAGRWARDALALGISDLVAAGGDGTVSQVARAIAAAGGEATLGIVPLGTGNDLATAAGLPVGDPAAALRVALESPAVPVDLVRGGEGVFLNMATGGFVTRVTAKTSPLLKDAVGPLAYVLTGIGHPEWFAPTPGRIRGEGFSWEGSFLAFAFGNGASAGGGFELCPRAKLDDGLLEVVVLRTDPARELVSSLGEILGEIEGKVLRWRTPWIEVAPTGAEPLELNLDGEPHEVPASGARFEVVPGGLRLRVPRGSPLLSGGGP